MRQRGSAPVLFLIVVFILAAAVGLYFFISSQNSSTKGSQQFWENYESDPVFGLIGFTSTSLQYGKVNYQIQVVPSGLEKIYSQDFPCQEQKIIEGYKGNFKIQLQEGTDKISIGRDSDGRKTSVSDTRILNLDHKFIKLDELNLGERVVYSNTEQDGLFADFLPVSLNPVVEVVALAERIDCFNTKVTFYGIDPTSQKLTVYKFIGTNGQVKDSILIPKGIKISQRDAKFGIIEDYYDADKKIRIKITYKFDPNQNSFIEVSNELTRDWKTYINSKYYYQIKYPNDWKESTENVADGDLVLLSPKNEVVFIIYNTNPQKLSLEQNHKQNWPDKTYQVVIISGKKAIKSEFGFYNILLDDGGYLNISYDGCYGMSCEASPSHIEKFNQILSTFRFTY